MAPPGASKTAVNAGTQAHSIEPTFISTWNLEYSPISSGDKRNTAAYRHTMANGSCINLSELQSLLAHSANTSSDPVHGWSSRD